MKPLAANGGAGLEGLISGNERGRGRRRMLLMDRPDGVDCALTVRKGDNTNSENQQTPLLPQCVIVIIYYACAPTSEETNM